MGREISYKCDRCKTLVTVSELQKNKIANKMNMIKGPIGYNYIRFTDVTHIEFDYEFVLCENCTEKLIEWIQEDD